MTASEFDADAAKTSLDVKDVAMGVSTVCFELRRNGEAKPVGRASLEFTRVANLPDLPVRIDGSGRTIVRGKPFFPLGGFGGFPGKTPEKTLECVRRLKTSPFNCVMSYEHLTKEHLDLLHEHGLMAIYCIADAWVGDGLGKRFKTEEDAEAHVREKVAQFRGHPALLAWYTDDEKPITMRNALIRRDRLVRKLDPGHPTWSVFYQTGDMRDYLPVADVIGSDPYPVPMYPLSSAYGSVEATRRAHEPKPSCSAEFLTGRSNAARTGKEQGAANALEMRL